VWWDWEPRLTTYFILTLLVVAYFVLRNAVEDEERRALYAAAFCILAFVDVPISFFITRLIPSNHPVIERGGLEGPMLVTFIVAQIGMIALGYAIYQLRMGEMLLKDRLETAKTRLEG
jgi:heme exporter protein C